MEREFHSSLPRGADTHTVKPNVAGVATGQDFCRVGCPTLDGSQLGTCNANTHTIACCPRDWYRQRAVRCAQAGEPGKRSVENHLPNLRTVGQEPSATQLEQRWRPDKSAYFRQSCKCWRRCTAVITLRCGSCSCCSAFSGPFRSAGPGSLGGLRCFLAFGRLCFITMTIPQKHSLRRIIISHTHRRAGMSVESLSYLT